MENPKETVVPETNPATDGEKTPAATKEKQDGGTPANPEDVNEIIRKRDQNHERARTAEEKIADLEARLDDAEADKQRSSYVDGLVTKHNFDSTEREILMDAVSPEHADRLAERLAKHKEDAKQGALAEINDVETPAMTPESKAEKLKSLEGTGRVEEAIDVMLS